MQSCGGEILLQAKPLGKFGRGLVELRILREEHSEFVVQIRPSWVEFHCAAQFADRAGYILLEAQQAPERAMGFAVGWSKLPCVAGLVYRSFDCTFDIPPGRQRVSKIDVRLREVWLQRRRGSELRDRLIQIAGF